MLLRYYIDLIELQSSMVVDVLSNWFDLIRLVWNVIENLTKKIEIG